MDEIPKRHRRGRSALIRGQSTVEFALASVAIVLMLGGLVDLGRAFAFSITIEDAVREGARHGAWFNQSNRTNPYLYDAAIKSTVDSVLTHQGMPASTLINPSTTCPSTTDGNADFNPPYVDSAYPTQPGASYLYICYENSAGTDLQVAPANATPWRLQDLNVIVLYSYQPLTGLLPLPNGVIRESSNWHEAIQGHA
jgi:Flp pilus assembly protein TadG